MSICERRNKRGASPPRRMGTRDEGDRTPSTFAYLDLFWVDEHEFPVFHNHQRSAGGDRFLAGQLSSADECCRRSPKIGVLRLRNILMPANSECPRQIFVGYGVG